MAESSGSGVSEEIQKQAADLKAEGNDYFKGTLGVAFSRWLTTSF
jgi:hypothetical protein